MFPFLFRRKVWFIGSQVHRVGAWCTNRSKVIMSTPSSMNSTSRRVASQRINNGRTPPQLSSARRNQQDNSSSKSMTTPTDQQPNDQRHSFLTAGLVSQIAGVSHHSQLSSIVRLDLDLRQHDLAPIKDITNLGALVPNVKLLNLAFNSISKMDGFDATKHLVELNLAENRIQTMNLSSLRGLQRLNLSGNQIRRLPQSISELQQLSVLRLSRNLLEVVGDLRYLVPLQLLNHLRIDDNPFSDLEKTVPFALFCVPSLDSINGCEVMPHERKDAVSRFQQLTSAPTASNSKVRFDDDNDDDKENAPQRRQSTPSTPDATTTPLPEKRRGLAAVQTFDGQPPPVQLTAQRLRLPHQSDPPPQSQSQPPHQSQPQSQLQSKPQSQAQSQSQSRSQRPVNSRSLFDDSTFSRDSTSNDPCMHRPPETAHPPLCTPSASSHQFQSPVVTSP